VSGAGSPTTALGVSEAGQPPRPQPLALPAHRDELRAFLSAETERAGDHKNQQSRKNIFSGCFSRWLHTDPQRGLVQKGSRLKAKREHFPESVEGNNGPFTLGQLRSAQSFGSQGSVLSSTPQLLFKLN